MTTHILAWTYWQTILCRSIKILLQLSSLSIQKLIYGLKLTLIIMYNLLSWMEMINLNAGTLDVPYVIEKDTSHRTEC